MMLAPDIETLPWAQQRDADDRIYRRQIAYLFAHSRFYQEKLARAGFRTPDTVGGLDRIATLPLVEKDELRAGRSQANPIGTHLAQPFDKLVRIFSTSGTTGTPSFIPLTANDLKNWVLISSRTYAAPGVKAGDRLISTYNAGPFVAGVTLDAFAALGVCHIPVGSGNTERLMTAVRLLKPHVIAMTPSYALHLAEWAAARGMNTAASSVRRLLVAGEPGGGEPAMRARLETAWGADVTEAMGIGDIAASLWGECAYRYGMHFSGRGIVHFELVDPDSGQPVPLEEGAEGELVYTHLRQEAAPLLRFRSRDHVRLWMAPCPCGRTAPRVRCIGRTDDMLVVRGVNVFPSAIREIVDRFAPAVTGVISVRPRQQGFRQDPPLTVIVECSCDPPPDLADRICIAIRDALLVTTTIDIVPQGTLPRSDYKSRLVDWSNAKAP
jgi:phenylacetate-CoA ligase